MSEVVFKRRVDRCARMMEESGIDVLLLARPANMFYLTGDGRLCSYALVTRDGVVALGVPVTDTEDVRRVARFDYLEGFEDEVGMIHSIAHYFSRLGIREGTMGLEYTFLTGSMMAMFTHPHAKPQAVEVRDCTRIMSRLRLVKEPGEIERIRASAAVAAKAMASAVAAVQPGATESQVAAAAEQAMRFAGAEGFWRTYVASGPRTNIAHGLPTSRRISAGDLVMIDLHPIVDGYSSDICRTVCAGDPTAEQEEAYGVYLKAQQAAVSASAAGATLARLEEGLNAVLRTAGHASHVFGPPIHGVGIEFEEAPLPAGHAFFHGEEGPPPLEANVVIAVGNCGLYTGPWGVRVEDTVVVGTQGPRMLTQFPYRLRKA